MSNTMSEKLNSMGILVARQNALRGDWYITNPDFPWDPPRKKLLLFISSSLNDSNIERNVLHEKILPSIRQTARLHNIDVSFVDMHHGMIRTGSQCQIWLNDQQRELERCRMASCGLFFLSLLGDQYGNRPLPKTIEAEAFEERLHAFRSSSNISTSERENILELVHQWYFLDSNAVPSVYCHAPIAIDERETYESNLLPILREIMNGVQFDKTIPSLHVGRSSTDAEITAAMQLNEGTNGILWIRRVFDRESLDIGSDDDDNDTCESKLLDLQATMNVANISRSTIKVSLDDFQSQQGDGFSTYLSEWETKVQTVLDEALDKLVTQVSHWAQDGSGLGIDGDHAEELLHHAMLARHLCSTFVGRTASINDAVRNILVKQETIRVGGVNDYRQLYAGIWLCIVGKSGTGKSAFMAKLAARLREEETSLHQKRRKSIGSAIRPVLIRFCGTSKRSVDGLTLVQSLCYQIQIVFPYEENKDVPRVYDEAVALLHHYLRKHAVILLIDGLDQLSDVNMARSRISFLAGLQPHPFTRIIVSTLPDDKRAPIRMTRALTFRSQAARRIIDSPIGKLTYGCVSSIWKNTHPTTVAPSPPPRALSRFAQSFRKSSLNVRSIGSKSSDTTAIARRKVYNCDSCLLTASVPRICIHSYAKSLELTTRRSSKLSITGWAERKPRINEAKLILESILERRGRTLTPTQWKSLMTQVAGEPTALYLNLAGYVVSKWTSYHVVEDALTELPSSVEELADRIFESLEREHGRALTRAALGFLVFSLHGVTDMEMEDLLSLDESVVLSLKDICNESVEKRVCGSLWLRLREDLDTLLVEHNNCCLQLSHRRLHAAAADRYSVDPDEKRYRHAIMGRYFGNIVPLDTVRKRSVICQPLVAAFVVQQQTVEQALNDVENDDDVDVGPSASGGNSKRSYSRRSGGGGGSGVSVHSMIGGILSSLAGSRRGQDSLKSNVRKEEGGVRGGSRSPSPRGAPSPRVAPAPNSRPVSSRKLLHVSSAPVMLRSVQVNSRRAVEASHHLLEAGLLVEAEQELCSIETITGRLKVGLIFDAVDHLERLCTLLRGQLLLQPHRAKQESLHRAEQYYRWLMMDAVKLHAKPHLLTCSCTTQPLSSVARKEMEILLKQSSNGHITSATEDSWIRSRGLGGNRHYEVLLSTFKGHSSFVTCVSWSNDGARIASGSHDGTVRIWNASNGTELSVLKAPFAQVFSLRFSPKGDQLAACGCDKNIISIWNVNTETMTAYLPGHLHPVLSICWAPCGNKLVSGSADNTARVWDVTEERVQGIFRGHGSWVVATAWAPLPFNGQPAIASGGVDKIILIWNPSTFEIMLELKQHSGWVVTLDWCPQSRYLLSGSKDRTILYWDVESRTVIRTLVGHRDELLAVSFSSDGRHVLSCSLDQTVRIWTIASGAMKSMLQGHTGGVFACCWSPGDTRIVSGGEDKNVMVWDAQIKTVSTDIVGHKTPVLSLSWAPSGDRILTVSGDGVALVWDVAEGSVLYTLDDSASGGCTCCAWSPHGLYLAFGNVMTISVRDARHGTAVFNITRNDYPITSIDWSADSQFLAVGSDKRAIVWDVSSRKPTETFFGHSDDVTSISWCKNGESVATGSKDRSVIVWRIGSGRKESLSFAGDTDAGDNLRTNSSADNTHSNTNNNKRLKRHTAEVTTVAYCPDMLRLASGSADHTVIIWEIDHATPLFCLHDHENIVRSVHWSTDGHRLVSAGLDKDIFLYNSSLGELVAILEGHLDGVNCAKFDPVGKYIVSCGDDKLSLVWDTVEGDDIFLLNNEGGSQHDNMMLHKRVTPGPGNGLAVGGGAGGGVTPPSHRSVTPPRGNSFKVVGKRKASDLRPGEMFVFLNARKLKVQTSSSRGKTSGLTRSSIKVSLPSRRGSGWGSSANAPNGVIMPSNRTGTPQPLNPHPAT